MERNPDEHRGSGVKGMRPAKSLTLSVRCASRTESRDGGGVAAAGDAASDRATKTPIEGTRVIPRSSSRLSTGEDRDRRASRGGSSAKDSRSERGVMRKQQDLVPSLGTETRRRKQTQMELEELRKRLHNDEGRPFSRLQKELMSSEEEDEKLSLQRALNEATGMSLTAGAMEELGRMSGSLSDYSKILDCLWDDRMVGTSSQTGSAPRRPPLAPRYLFFYDRPAGFYNDNIQPSPHFYGVKKSSSSVRYNLFTNERSDVLSRTLPRSFVDRLDSEMKIVPANHPVTKRPLDPWLCHLSIGQGKKCGNTLEPVGSHLGAHNRREGDKGLGALPTMSVCFSRFHKGYWPGAEKLNMLV